MRKLHLPVGRRMGQGNENPENVNSFLHLNVKILLNIF